MRTLVAIALMGLGLGCGDDHDHDHGEGDHLKCTGHEQTYEAGMVQATAEGLYNVKLEGLMPADGAIGANMMTVEIQDADGNALPDAAIHEAATWQHVHDHGGGGSVTTTSLGDGRFEIHGLCVVHQGSWEFRITVMNDGKMEMATFHFCVPDVMGDAECTAPSDGGTDGHESHGT